MRFWILLGFLGISWNMALAQPAGERIPFHGVQGYQVQLDSVPLSPEHFSVTCWVQWKSGDRSQMFVGIDIPRKDFSLYLYEGNIRMLVEQDEMSYSYALAPAPSANQWVHLAGTYDGQTIRLYINGELKGTKKARCQRKRFGTNLYLGAVEEPDRTLEGAMADIRLYNQALSAETILKVVQNQEVAEKPLAWWKSLPDTEGKLGNAVPNAPAALPHNPCANALLNQKDTGFRSIWYYNQASGDEYGYKYSGGLGVYPANHYPFAVYRPEVEKTFFCYGGTDVSGQTLLHEVSYFDHRTKQVARPTIILDKKTEDAHDNPVMTIDDQGHIWVFSTSHGTWRPSFIHRSVRPYDIGEFELVTPTKEVDGKPVPMTNFSYVQVFQLPGKGMEILFTTYDKSLLQDPTSKAQRILCFMNSRDGVTWSAWQPLAAIAYGHYQNGAVYQNGNLCKIGTSFNYHPHDPVNGRLGLNWRTNLYYMESLDEGKTWQAITGEKIDVPLKEIQTPALVYDYDTLRKNVYIMDMVYDAQGYPVIFYITSNGYRSGPEAGPREWWTAAWNGENWEIYPVTESDNNYDFGSLYIEKDGTWRMIGTDGFGPQKYNTGGEVSLWTSQNRGKTWTKVRQMTENSPMNHCYPRRPINAHPEFYAIWADGHGRQKSEANLFFCNQQGDVFQLPREMKGDFLSLEELRKK